MIKQNIVALVVGSIFGVLLMAGIQPYLGNKPPDLKSEQIIAHLATQPVRLNNGYVVPMRLTQPKLLKIVGASAYDNNHGTIYVEGQFEYGVHLFDGLVALRYERVKNTWYFRGADEMQLAHFEKPVETTPPDQSKASPPPAPGPPEPPKAEPIGPPKDSKPKKDPKGEGWVDPPKK